MKKIISDRKLLISVSVFLGFTLCIYAPYELYLTNVGEFWFGLPMFWWMPFATGLCVVSLLIFVGLLLKNKAAFVYEVFLFVLSICMYVQGNFLNIRIGVMNGAQVEWEKYKGQFVRNGVIIVLLAIVLMVVILTKYSVLKKPVILSSFFLTAIQAVSLIVLLIGSWADIKDNGVKYTMAVTDKGLYEIGSESNIVIFILDMFDDSYFKEILDSEPEIKQELDGFTYFSNFTGSYSTTNYAMSHLATGKYFYNESSWQEYWQRISNDRLYLDEIIDNGYDLGVYSDFIGSFVQRHVDATNNYIKVPLEIGHKVHFIFDFYHLAVIKYLPDFLKPHLWMTGTEFEKYKSIESEYNAYSTENLAFKEGLEKSGVSVAGDKKISFIHITGAHYPYLIDEYGQEVEPDSVSAVQCARGSLRIVQEYLDGLKRCGKYDNTNIILAADHGYYWDGVLTNPLFAVKPHDSSGELIINNAPVSQADFAPTVLGLIGLNEDHAYGESAFEIDSDSQRQRIFYQYYLQENRGGAQWRLIEYRIPPESNDPEGFTLTDVEYTVNGKKN